MSTQKKHKSDALKKTKFLHCRVDEQIKTLAENAAQAERRTLTSWIEVAILEKAERDERARKKKSEI